MSAMNSQLCADEHAKYCLKKLSKYNKHSLCQARSAYSFSKSTLLNQWKVSQTRKYTDLLISLHFICNIVLSYEIFDDSIGLIHLSVTEE